MVVIMTGDSCSKGREFESRGTVYWMSVSHLEAEQSEDCQHKDGQDDDVSQVLDGVNDGVDDGLYIKTSIKIKANLIS